MVLGIPFGEETGESARERATGVVTDVVAATGRSADDYVVDVVDGDSEGGLDEVLGQYETVCVGYARPGDSPRSVDGIVETATRIGRNVALVRSSAGDSAGSGER